MRAERAPARYGKVVGLLIVGMIVSGMLGFGGGMIAVQLNSEQEVTTLDHMKSSDGGTIVTTDEELISHVADTVAPSVVSIVVSSGSSSFLQSSQGAGTGVIISDDGYIMTNNHVIEGARAISVILSDGTEHSSVRVIGSDPLNDIAFLKVNNVSDLTPAELGDSSKLRVGQQVVAIGNALGQFQNTVTSGIVSAVGRPLVAASSDGSNAERLSDLVQTDAAINPGNSGGPLVDLSGRVIGINTAVASDASGIGFAIPINATRGVLKGVLESGRVERAYLGVRYVDITPEIAASEDLSVKKGAYVQPTSSNPIERDSPAEKAGIRAGDIIVRVNDEDIGERGNMSSIIGQYQPGNVVELAVVRDGKEIAFKVKLAAYAAD